MTDFPARVAVFGCDGYLGSRLARTLLALPEVELVVGFGRRRIPVIRECARYRYVQGDVQQAPLAGALRDHDVRALVHLIFLSRPTRDDRLAQKLSAYATARVFDAAATANLAQAVLVSSTAVYGPGRRARPAGETEPAQPDGFQFSRYKVVQEQAALQAASRRSVPLTIVRPCTVVGPRVRNFLMDFLRRPLVPIPAGADPDWQFLHEDDFCRAVVEVLRHRASGTYNLVPDDTVKLRMALAQLGARPLSLPSRLLTAGVTVGWKAGLRWLVPAPATAIPYLYQPPIAANAAIRAKLGFQFTYDSLSALRAMHAG